MVVGRNLFLAHTLVVPFLVQGLNTFVSRRYLSPSEECLTGYGPNLEQQQINVTVQKTSFLRVILYPEYLVDVWFPGNGRCEANANPWLFGLVGFPTS